MSPEAQKKLKDSENELLRILPVIKNKNSE